MVRGALTYAFAFSVLTSVLGSWWWVSLYLEAHSLWSLSLVDLNRYGFGALAAGWAVLALLGVQDDMRKRTLDLLRWLLSFWFVAWPLTIALTTGSIVAWRNVARFERVRVACGSKLHQLTGGTLKINDLDVDGTCGASRFNLLPTDSVTVLDLPNYTCTPVRVGSEQQSAEAVRGLLNVPCDVDPAWSLSVRSLSARYSNDDMESYCGAARNNGRWTKCRSFELKLGSKGLAPPDVGMVLTLGAGSAQTDKCIQLHELELGSSCQPWLSIPQGTLGDPIVNVSNGHFLFDGPCFVGGPGDYEVTLSATICTTADTLVPICELLTPSIAEKGKSATTKVACHEKI